MPKSLPCVLHLQTILEADLAIGKACVGILGGYAGIINCIGIFVGNRRIFLVIPSLINQDHGWCPSPRNKVKRLGLYRDVWGLGLPVILKKVDSKRWGLGLRCTHLAFHILIQFLISPSNTACRKQFEDALNRSQSEKRARASGLSVSDLRLKVKSDSKMHSENVNDRLHEVQRVYQHWNPGLPKP